jgi:hypothetical protein
MTAIHYRKASAVKARKTPGQAGPYRTVNIKKSSATFYQEINR